MEDFSKYLGINRTLSLICCMFWMFSPADGATVSKVVGNRAILHCSNESIGPLAQLTWKKDGVTLFSHSPHKDTFVSEKARELNIKMSASESPLYPLIIESVQMFHGGNYACETTTGAGALEKNWELIITDGATVSKVVGNRAILHCSNESIGPLAQLTWKKDGVTLFSLSPHKDTYVSEKAQELNIYMSASESPLYPLIIESVQTSHGGNYTCETTTGAGALEKNWELIITEHVEGENWYKTVIAVAVPCVCCLTFIITLIVLHWVRKRRARNSVQAPTAEMHQEKTEDIYENCLESRRQGYNERYRPRPH